MSGLFPETYTQRTAESDAWTLHKKIPLTHLPTSEAKSTAKKESKPSTCETDVYKVTSTTDEVKFTVDSEPKEEKETVEVKNLYENLLDVKEQASELEVSWTIKLSFSIILDDWIFSLTESTFFQYPVSI